MDIKLHNTKKVNLDYRKVQPFQENLTTVTEEAYQKCLSSLKTEGNFLPCFVWKNPKDGTYYLLDGHTRHMVYNGEELTFAGKHIIPYLLIEAKNEKQAKKRLLLIKSNYGKVTKAGLTNFADTFDDTWIENNLQFDSISSFDFMFDDVPPKQTKGEKKAKGKETKTTNTNKNNNPDDEEFSHLLVVFTKEDRELFDVGLQKLKENQKIDDDAKALIYLMGDYITNK